MRILLLFISFLIHSASNAQFNGQNPSSPSREVSLSKNSLEVSDDLYNGKINISLPVFNYEFEGINFPISLNYASSNGVKPDELPGWVGSGWNLNNGAGYIHRTVRGKPDEVRDFETRVYYYYDFTFGLSTVKKQTILNNTDFSYFSNTNKLNQSNWNTAAYAISINSLPNVPLYSTDLPWSNIGYYNFTQINPSPTYDLVPDEYTFSAGGISGKFYLNHLNKWVVSATDGQQYTVNVTTGEQTVVDYSVPSTGGRVYYKVPRIIKQITLTSQFGVRYFFGSININSSFENQVFDYSHSSHLIDYTSPGWFMTAPAQYVSGNTAATLIDIVPHTWHLTKVENLKTGSSITFDYKQEGLEFYKDRQAWGSGNNVAGYQLVYNNSQTALSNPDDPSSWFLLSAISKVISRKWTLVAINFPDNTKIEFASTPSTQLSTNESLWTSDNASFYNFEDLYHRSGVSGQKNTLLKLDRITVLSGGITKKQYEFEYQLSGSQRLQLSKLKEKNISGNLFNEYTFGYNNTVSLPLYGAGKNDHWGFYNNKDYFLSVPASSLITSISTYPTYREPDFNYGSAEILNKVTYPTGGFMTLEYEPHSYSVTRNFSTVNTGSSDFTAGGVRVKNTKYFTGVNSLAITKNYEYLNPTNSLSSGVRAITPDNYVSMIGSNGGLTFRAEGWNHVNYQGGNVTYSFASIRQTGNGKSVYGYSNYDNGFNDAASPQGDPSVLSGSFSTPYVNNAFKRGKPIWIKEYSESGVLVREQNFGYEHSRAETNKDEVRSLYLSLSGSASSDFASVSERKYNDNLVSKSEIDYTVSGVSSNEVNYIYDDFGNVKETLVKNNNGRVNRIKYKYCYEFPGTGTDLVSQGINNLNFLGIKKTVIEAISIEQNTDGSNPMVTSGKLYVYNSNNTFLNKEFRLNLDKPIPLSIFNESTVSGGGFVKDVRYNSLPEIEYTKYDIKGHLLESIGRDGVIASNVWGYSNSYLVATIVGINYNSIISLLNQGILNSPSSDQELRDHLNGLRSLSGSFVTTYTMNPLVGVTSETDPNGKTQFLEYDGLNRLSLIKDQDNNILRKICYNYAGQPEDCPIAANGTPQWRTTGQIRCQPCASNSSYNSGYKEREEKDINPATNLGFRWVVDISLGTCPNPPEWINGTSYCEQGTIAPYEYTGNQVVVQVNINPCSPTFNTTQQVIVPNAVACPTCSPACNAPSQKCINGTCVTGTWQIIKVKKIAKTGPWECTYAWCFPDHTVSNYKEVIISSTACNITCF